MEIIKTNIDTANKKLVYKLTKSASIMVQGAPEGISIPINAWALYNDPKEARDGTMKEQQVLSFIDNDGAKYSTISPTFIREFMVCAEIMDGEPFAILLIHGTSKNGKAFVSCELDCDFQL